MEHIFEEIKTNEELQSMYAWSGDQPEMKLFLRLCSSVGIGSEFLTSDEISYIHGITNRLSRLLDTRWKTRANPCQTPDLQDE